MLKLNAAAILLLIIAFSVSSFGQTKVAYRADAPPQIFPLAELKEGMRGTANTVFRGTRSEEFNVEILGVIPGWIGPKQDMIVGRLSGGQADRTFVFAGMSGSPVYINGRLVGAISYSFPFAKEPICGITPIEQMLSNVAEKPAVTNGAKPVTFSLAELQGNDLRRSITPFAERALASGFSSDSRLMAIAGQTFRPIATPVSISGLSQRTIDMFAGEFERAGILPVAASGGTSTIAPMKKADATTLLGGDSVVVHLTRGDVQIAAAGTVTLRDGNKIYAFGHPFFSLGSSALPMSESHVVTVVPNANNSFKLAVPDATVGAMTQDRSTGIYGILGAEPKMIPVKVRLTTSRGTVEETSFDTGIDELITPLLINAGVANILSAQERSLGETTMEVTGEITIKGEQPITIRRRFTGLQALGLASSAAAVPVSALLRANFDNLQITGVTLNISSTDGSRTAVIDRLSLDRDEVRAGDTLDLTAYIRTDSGKILTQKIPVTIPQNTAPGMISVLVGDGNAAQQGTAVTQFTPRSAADLISTINKLKRSDRLYAVLTRTSTGTVIGSSEMPNLPPSVLATINNDRTVGGTRPTVQTLLAEFEIPPMDFIVTGSQSLTIRVVK